MRIITRGDFDGLVSSVLIAIFEPIDGISFVHPKDMQDGKVDVDRQDILLNLPYHPECGMWFDHHSSEKESAKAEFNGRFEVAPSCARVVYKYYQEEPDLKKYDELLDITDKIDSAQLTVSDVENPEGWVLLSYTLDPRTGFTDYRDYFLKLTGWIRTLSLDEIMGMDEVKERCQKVLEEQEAFAAALKKHSRADGNVTITDVRGVKDLPRGNRFLIYTLFPGQNISVRIFDGKKGEFSVIACGHNIFKRDSKTDIGALMKKYGGGGHKGAGTCQTKPDEADRVLGEIVEQMKKDG